MANRKTDTTKSKWLAYTFLIGLTPIFARLLVWLTSKGDSVSAVSASDLVSFGLVLHVSNINELEHLSRVDKDWKTIQNGVSIIFIALYSVLYTAILIGDKNTEIIEQDAILYSVTALSFVSTALSLSIFHRISAQKPRVAKP